MCPRGFVQPTWASKDCKPWVTEGKGGGGGGNGGALEAGGRAVPSDVPRYPAGGADGILFRPPEEVQPPESSLLASLLRAMPRESGWRSRPARVLLWIGDTHVHIKIVIQGTGVSSR